MTVHKAQGSQFPRVIVALSRGLNVDRAWLYTSITRAEHEIHIVGPIAKFIYAIQNVSNASKRQTNLVNLLQSK
jgi:exodeoxyribonuclease V alpha subunit